MKMNYKEATSIFDRLGIKASKEDINSFITEYINKQDPQQNEILTKKEILLLIAFIVCVISITYATREEVEIFSVSAAEISNKPNTFYTISRIQLGENQEFIEIPSLIVSTKDQHTGITYSGITIDKGVEPVIVFFTETDQKREYATIFFANLEMPDKLNETLSEKFNAHIIIDDTEFSNLRVQYVD